MDAPPGGFVSHCCPAQKNCIVYFLYFSDNNLVHMHIDVIRHRGVNMGNCRLMGAEMDCRRKRCYFHEFYTRHV